MATGVAEIRLSLRRIFTLICRRTGTFLRRVASYGRHGASMPALALSMAASRATQNCHVVQMTWAPGQPMLIENRLISEGGWIVKPGCRIFNLYRPPNVRLGNSKRIEPWRYHLERIYPDDADD